LTPLLAFAAASSAPREFEGRWNIEVLGQNQPRAWWLEVGEPGTGKGRFGGAPGGQTDDIRDVVISGGELRFSLSKAWRGGRKPPVEATFTARLIHGRLEGVLSLDGEAKLKWIGRRAPVLPDKDDGTWREGTPVTLFNGKDLSGWYPLGNPVAFIPPAPLHPGMVNGIGESGWMVKEGCLSTLGNATYLVSTAKFWNFALHVKYRVGEHGNSGICLRGRYELQVFDDHGRAVDSHSAGGIYGRILPARNVTKPAGEWQSYDVRLVGRQVTVISNGIPIIQRQEIEGPTAVATDPNEDQPGPLSLQGDHGAVDFQEIVLTPLVR
jgi:3-keto-disaccharide hydrolase